MIELDVVDDGDVGQVFEEFGGLVEERAVVLVPLDHEIAALTDPVARSVIAEVSRDAADEHAGIDTAMRQQPAGERRRRRLAMRAGNDDRARTPQEVFADRLGKRAVANLSIEHFFELGVPARDRVADHDEIQITTDVLGAVADEDGHTLGSEELAHRRIDVLIRPSHVEAFALQHRRKRRHSRAADADEVNP